MASVPANASKVGIVTMKQRHQVKRKKRLEMATSLDTRPKEMTKRKSLRNRPLPVQGLRRKTMSNPTVRSSTLLEQVFKVGPRRCVALSILVLSLPVAIRILPERFQDLLHGWLLCNLR